MLLARHHALLCSRSGGSETCCCCRKRSTTLFCAATSLVRSWLGRVWQCASVDCEPVRLESSFFPVLHSNDRVCVVAGELCGCGDATVNGVSSAAVIAIGSTFMIHFCVQIVQEKRDSVFDCLRNLGVVVSGLATRSVTAVCRRV